MKNFSLASHPHFFTTCNSVIFIIGIAGFFLQSIITTSICMLLLSLLFLIYQFIQPDLLSDEVESDTLPIADDDEDTGKIQLALKVQELTETNEQLSLELNKTKWELRKEQEKIPNITKLYNFPLKASIPTDLTLFLESYLQEKKSVLKERSIHLSYQKSSDELITNLSNRAINTIFDNLFDNILKFTPVDGSLYVRLAKKENDQILLILKNSCKPISESDVMRIFELNYQSSNHLLGNGLGLAQAKAIVDDFGGEIWAKATNENGFTIYLQLPIFVVNNNTN